MKTGTLLVVLFARLVAIAGIVVSAVPLVYSSPEPFPWDYLIALLTAVGVYLGTYFYGDYLTWLQQGGRAGSPHDRELLAAFRKLFPPGDTAQIYGSASFGGHFPEEWFSRLSRFADEWDTPTRRFLDRQLERYRRRLYASAKRAAAEIAQRTVPANGDQRTAKAEIPGPQPPQYGQDVRCIEKAVRDFAKRYEEFEWLACRRLDAS